MYMEFGTIHSSGIYWGSWKVSPADTGGGGGVDYGTLYGETVSKQSFLGYYYKSVNSHEGILPA